MRTSGWCGIVLSLLAAFVLVGCGGGLTAENKKVADDWVAKANAMVAEKDAAKKAEIGKDLVALGVKIAAFKDDQKKAFDKEYKTKFDDLTKKMTEALPK